MGFDDTSTDSGPRRGGHGPRRSGRGRRRAGPLGIAARSVGVLVLLAVVAVGGYLFYLQRTVAGNVEHEDLKADKQTEITISPDGARQPGQDDAQQTGDGAEVDTDGEDGTAPIVGEDGKALDVDGTTVPVTTPDRDAAAGDALNFLIIGSDSRDLSVERGRSDVIVLAHVDDARDRVDLIHFPRDLFVPIAGTGGSSKINASYSYGGAPLLIQTLQPLINVPIDHVAIVDFESFKAMTDAIGGVDVTVTESGGGFSAGVQHMDGEQGLRFVRERKSLSQGDISRGERQMQFIKAVLGKALSRDTLTNPVRLANLVDAATTNLTVDDSLKVSDMRNLAISMRDVRGGDIHFWQGPWCGIDMHPVAGSIVLMADSQMARLSEHLRNDTMDTYVDDVSPKAGFAGNCG
ncbi:LCP family protein [Ornithinimicrobium avium]|uniref:LytR family transcriptional regulator n=1 Tax=Ornithinimicrobium avium TaxID=2283195 RepID=A0A345NMB7_9MICO|nr:LCP family protein [Ornithinimicrobium avium]AXH96175.1 LytR family transcriptional regulator [Ornithinimicrobium avium]